MVTKKNGGEVPLMKDHRIGMVPIGCQKCIECRKQKARHWGIRLTEDIKDHKNATFVTLTFNDMSYNLLRDECKSNPSEYEIDNEIATLATRRFLERWRKKYSKSIRHWLITELGGTRTERIHLHGILYTENKNDINKIWSYGYTYIGDYVNSDTCKYIVKYLHKTDLKHKEYKPIILCSKGIGSSYLEKHNSTLNRFKGTDTKETYTYSNGSIAGLPTYYRNKIYTDEEREILWINLLNKQKRYVLGQEIDMSKPNSVEMYYNCLKNAQAKNIKLGYGDDSINWEQKRYENERRKLLRKRNDREL